MVNDSEGVMLTTLDNPFNPFTQFDEWNAFDISMGYNTCAYLARIAKDSEELSNADENLSMVNAINEILSYNLTGNYIKVTENNFSEFLTNRKDVLPVV